MVRMYSLGTITTSNYKEFVAFDAATNLQIYKHALESECIRFAEMKGYYRFDLKTHVLNPSTIRPGYYWWKYDKHKMQYRDTFQNGW